MSICGLAIRRDSELDAVWKSRISASTEMTFSTGTSRASLSYLCYPEQTGTCGSKGSKGVSIRSRLSGSLRRNVASGDGEWIRWPPAVLRLSLDALAWAEA